MIDISFSGFIKNMLISLGAMIIVVFVVYGFQFDSVVRGLWRLADNYLQSDSAAQNKFKIVVASFYFLLFSFVSVADYLNSLSEKKRRFTHAPA